jgi:hypothetical protein
MWFLGTGVTFFWCGFLYYSNSTFSLLLCVCITSPTEYSNSSLRGMMCVKGVMQLELFLSSVSELFWFTNHPPPPKIQTLEIYIMFLNQVLFFLSYNGMGYTDWTLIPWSRVILNKMAIVQVATKFPAFYAARRFITVFTRLYPILRQLNPVYTLGHVPLRSIYTLVSQMVSSVQTFRLESYISSPSCLSHVAFLLSSMFSYYFI